MNPDNSLPSEGILDPRMLLRRFVKAVKHSPIPIATIPADNDVSFPAIPSGIIIDPSKKGAKFIMKPDNSEANEGILDPKILLKRFVIAVINSPIPIATIPADNDVNLPAIPSGIAAEPMRNG